MDHRGTAALLEDAAHRAIAYLEHLPSRRVAPSPDAVAALDVLDTPLPELGAVAADVLALLDDVGSPATVASAGGRYFGFVTGGALPVTVAASWLARAWDQNAALTAMSPVAATLQQISVDWLVDLFGLAPGTGGALVTGATMANTAGLLAGRNAVLRHAGWDVDADGLFGAPPVRVVVGAAAHSSVGKCLSMIGLGRRRVDVLPVDERGAVVATDLPALDPGTPTLVVLQAGNVDTGASDPFGPLLDWAHGGGAWVHVDGAFGLWATASPTRSRHVVGVDRADSWATDCHKWLNVPYDCGLVLVRDRADLTAALSQHGAYIQSAATHEAMWATPESSQRARGVEVWAALAHLGRAGVQALVDRCCDLAARAADGLRAQGFDVLNDVVLNQVLFRDGDDALTAALLEVVQRDGTAWMGGSEWDGRPAIRFSVSSWATTAADVDAAVAAVTEARSVAGEQR